jgi:hypothetical protein
VSSTRSPTSTKVDTCATQQSGGRVPFLTATSGYLYTASLSSSGSWYSGTCVGTSLLTSAGAQSYFVDMPATAPFGTLNGYGYATLSTCELVDRKRRIRPVFSRNNLPFRAGNTQTSSSTAIFLGSGCATTSVSTANNFQCFAAANSNCATGGRASAVFAYSRSYAVISRSDCYEDI